MKLSSPVSSTLLSAVIGTCLALSCAAPLNAQSGAPTAAFVSGKMTLAREIVRLGMPFDKFTADSVNSFERSFQSGLTSSPQGKQLAAQRPDVVRAALAAAKAEYERLYRLRVAPAMIAAVAGVYENNFSEAELQQIAGYMRTPETQRFLTSFSSDGTPDAAAANSGVVAAYRDSPLGRREAALNNEIADVLMKTSMAEVQKIMPAVNAKAGEAMKLQIAKPPR